MSNEFKKVVWAGIAALALGAAAPRPAGAQEADGLRKVTKRVTPLYPPLAQQSHMSGTVKLVAVVTPEGAVKNVRTIGGNAVLAAAAENAVKQWRFEVSKKESAEPVVVKFVEPQ